MKKILVVNINWLGDAVFSTAVFKGLRQLYPEAHIACLCVPRVAMVMRHCWEVDEIIVYDDKRWWSKIFQGLWLVFELRFKAFDMAILLHRSSWRSLLMVLAGIKKRVGYSKLPWLLTMPVDVPEHIVHRRDIYYYVLSALTNHLKPLATQLVINNNDRSRVEMLLAMKHLGDKEMVVINASGNWDLKRWPATYWRELIEQILATTSLSVVLTGAKSDVVYYQQLLNGFEHERLVNLAGQTSLGESLVLYQQSQLMICADSGPLHLADSVGAQTLGLYGPTCVEYTGPCGIGKSYVMRQSLGCNTTPCYLLSCRGNECMRSLTVQQVYEKIMSILSK